MEENPPAKKAKLKLDPRIMYETEVVSLDDMDMQHADVNNVFEMAEGEDGSAQILEYEEEEVEGLDGGNEHIEYVDEEDNYEENFQEKYKSVKGSKTKYIICQPDDALDTFKNSWTRGMTHVLIEEYRKMIDNFRDPYKRQKDLWITLAENMCHRGCDVTWDMCDQKWRNLKHTFKSIYYNKHRSEKSKRRWDFYVVLEDLFEPQINRTHVRKSRMLSPRHEDEDSNPSSISNMGMNNCVRNIKVEPATYFDSVINENGIVNSASYQVAENGQEEQDVDFTIVDNTPETSNDSPVWFQEFMKQYRSDEEQRIALIREMHTELLQVEKRKCAALEALLKKLG